GHFHRVVAGGRAGRTRRHLPAAAVGAGGRGCRGGGRRGGVGVVEHRVRRIRGRYRRGGPHRVGQPGHRGAVFGGDVRLTAGVGGAHRGRRGGPGGGRRDDGLASAPCRHHRVLGGAAGGADRGQHAVLLLDRQRHRDRVHLLGGDAQRRRQGP